MRAAAPRPVVVALALALASGAAACGDDDSAQPARTTTDPAAVSTSSTADDGGALPPADALDLESLYGEPLAAIGLKLTDRGGLIDRSGGGYVQSGEGNHLALYVEPIGDRSTAEYVDGILDVAAVFGDVFERWPGLESYDVCQEPVDPDGTQGPEPLPVTQIELTKAQAAAFDWDEATVVDLVRASVAQPRGITLRVSTDIAQDSSYQAAVADAMG